MVQKCEDQTSGTVVQSTYLCFLSFARFFFLDIEQGGGTWQARTAWAWALAAFWRPDDRC